MSYPKQTPSDAHCRPRDLEFVRSAPADRHWHVDGLTETAIFNALSIVFPEGERFFIEALKHHRSKSTGKLADDIKDFIGQEALHMREHAAFNALIDRNHYPVARAEALVRLRLGQARAEGPKSMLAVTIAMEHLTAVFADCILRDPSLVASSREDISRLWSWHSMEEAEHKGVAFDLFQVVATPWSRFRRYRVRVQTMIVATSLFLWNWTSIALWFMKADGVTGFRARWKLWRQMLGRNGLLRRSVPGMFAWFKPGFHPWDQDNRALIADWREKIDPDRVADAA